MSVIRNLELQIEALEYAIDSINQLRGHGDPTEIETKEQKHIAMLLLMKLSFQIKRTELLTNA